MLLVSFLETRNFFSLMVLFVVGDDFWLLRENSRQLLSSYNAVTIFSFCFSFLSLSFISEEKNTLAILLCKKKNTHLRFVPFSLSIIIVIAERGVMFTSFWRI
jgi:hypothetical protein